MAENIANYVAIKVASEASGVPGRTLRHWVVRGKVAAINGHAGKLVRLDDVMRLATLVGKDDGKLDGNATNGDGKDGKVAEHIATSFATVVATSPNSQLAAVMDEWVLPLVNRIGILERENGMLTAERNTLQERLTIQEASHAPERSGDESPHAEVNVAPEGAQRAEQASWRLRLRRWLGAAGSGTRG